jgi:hypothetical protein
MISFRGRVVPAAAFTAFVSDAPERGRVGYQAD